MSILYIRGKDRKTEELKSLATAKMADVKRVDVFIVGAGFGGAYALSTAFTS